MHAPTVESLRNLFLLRPDIAYLNHGSFGACPRPVFEAYQEWQQELEREPAEFLGRRFQALMHNSRRVLGDFVGAPADDLVYLPNATTALNTVARSLSLEPGEQVLATDHEYGAIDRMWRAVCQERGAFYQRQPVPVPVRSPEEIADAVWSGVTDRTRVLFLSHISSPTAIIFPVQELVRRARKAGIVTVLDGAHAPGQIDLSLRTLDADFYVGNCHKWMLAPKGAAFLYAPPRSQGILEPLVTSWGPERSAAGSSRLVGELEYQGTRDIASYLAVPAAAGFLSDHDWSRVQEHCHRLLDEAREGISALTGLPPLTPEGDTWYRQMCTLPLPPCDAGTVQRRLFDEFAVEVPVFDWNASQFVRPSIQGYNEPADVERLLAGLETLL